MPNFNTNDRNIDPPHPLCVLTPYIPESFPAFDTWMWNVSVPGCDSVISLTWRQLLQRRHADTSLKKLVFLCLTAVLIAPGQERHGNMTRVYYREAAGALVVFDVTRASTFDAVLKWKDDLDSKVPQLFLFSFFFQLPVDFNFVCPWSHRVPVRGCWSVRSWATKKCSWPRTQRAWQRDAIFKE